MSLDYPNRGDWLVMRKDSLWDRPPNFVHVSKVFWDKEEKDPVTGVVATVKMSQHCTVVAGRNKEKRFVAKEQGHLRRAVVRVAQCLGLKATKRNGQYRQEHLIARKLRQRQGDVRAVQ